MQIFRKGKSENPEGILGVSLKCKFYVNIYNKSFNTSRNVRNLSSSHQNRELKWSVKLKA